jgi:hypothetical protein
LTNKQLTKIQGKGETKEQTAQLKNLKDTMDALKETLSKTTSEQKAVTDAITKDTQAQRDNNKAQAERKEATDNFLLSLDQEKQAHKDEVADLIATHGKSLQEQTAYYEQVLSLLDKNNADQQERYNEVFKKLLDIQTQGLQKLYDAQTEAQNKLKEAQKTLDDQLDEQRKKELKEAQDDISGFLDDILTKHESFGSALKNIMTNIEKQYVQSISQMITNAPQLSAIFGVKAAPTAQQNVNTAQQALVTADNNVVQAQNAATQNMQTLTQTTTTANQNSTTLNQTSSTLNSSVGTLNNSMGTVNGTIGNNLVPALNNLTRAISSGSGSGGSGGLNLNGGLSNILGNSNSFSLGSGSNIQPNSMAYLFNTDSPTQYAADTSVAQTGAQGDASGIPADQINGSDNGLGATKSNGGGFGSYIGSAASIAGGLMTGNDTQVAAGVGGAIGTWIGTLGGATGGPLGGAIGTLLGTVLGSFIGPHPSAAQNPDLFESSTGYGATMADLVGVGINAAGANGTEYNTDSGTAAFIASQGITTPGINSKMTSNQDYSYGLQAMATYLNNYSATNLPPGISASQFASMQQILGTNPSDISFGTYNSNIGDLAVTGSNGTTDTTYSALGTYLQEIENSQSVAGGSTGVYSLTHSMPNFEKTTMQQIGTFTDGIYKGSTPTGTTPASGALTDVGPGSASSLLGINPNMKDTPKTNNVYVTVTGSLIGSGGISELTTKIEQMLLQNQFSNAGNRNSGNF